MCSGEEESLLVTQWETEERHGEWIRSGWMESAKQEQNCRLAETWSESKKQIEEREQKSRV